VANTLRLHRNGAVGFIDWLDGLALCSFRRVCNRARIIIRTNLFQLPVGDPETIEHGNHTERRIEVKLSRHKLALGNVTLDSNVSYDRKHAGQELLNGVDAADFGRKRAFECHIRSERNLAEVLVLQTVKVTFYNLDVRLTRNLINRA
jgi:hypothetical protein